VIIAKGFRWRGHSSVDNVTRVQGRLETLQGVSKACSKDTRRWSLDRVDRRFRQSHRFTRIEDGEAWEVLEAIVQHDQTNALGHSIVLSSTNLSLSLGCGRLRHDRQSISTNSPPYELASSQIRQVDAKATSTASQATSHGRGEDPRAGVACAE
jgi:hypothetical protein